MTEPPDTTFSRSRTVLLAALAFLLALVAYVPAFSGPFVWDDQTLLLRKEIAQLQPLQVYLSRPFWLSADWAGGAAYYRPLSILSLALDQAVHGANPAGFHFTNLLLHGVNAMLVLGLGRRLGARPELALLGALAFAWFPRLTEAVAWISGRTDLLATSFALGALLVTLGSGRGRTYTAAVLLLLGLLSKEVALAAAVAILGYEGLNRSGLSLRARALSLLPTTTALLIYFALRFRVLGHGFDPGDVGLGQRALAALESLGRYGFMLVVGWQPQLNIGSLAETNFTFVALGATLLVASIPLALRLRLRLSETLLLACGGLAIGLVIHVLPIFSTVLAADRFLYVPVATLVPVLAGRISTRALGAAGSRWLLGTGLVVLSYFPVTWLRAGVWGDSIAFWGTAVREQGPRPNAVSLSGLASLLAEHGMWEEAMAVYERVQPGDAKSFLLARHNQAQLLAMNGETERALVVLEEAARLQPLPRFYSTIAMLHTVAGRAEDAERAVSTYAQLIGDEAEARKLREQVASAANAKPRPLEPSASLAERIQHAQGLSKRLMFRVAMSELALLIDDPAMSTNDLRSILVFALGYGTPAQVDAIYRRLLELDPATPEEFSLLVSERDQEVRRLRRLCEELGVEVRS